MVVITGVSGGIGKALVEYYLNAGQVVVGIGRTNNNLQDPNYSFYFCDLSDLEQVQQLDLSFLKDETLIWINNAGVIGEIGRLSEIESADSLRVMTVNVLAIMELTKRLLHAFPLHQKLTLVNISSGAGRRAIPGWASYCTSKAALDMFSQCIEVEEKERNRPIHVLSVAPGVVDTGMQGKIRSANPQTFSSLETFIALKENEELRKPAEVAVLLDQLIQNSENHEVVTRI